MSVTVLVVDVTPICVTVLHLVVKSKTEDAVTLVIEKVATEGLVSGVIRVFVVVEEELSNVVRKTGLRAFGVVVGAATNPEPATKVLNVTDPSLQTGEISEKVDKVKGFTFPRNGSAGTAAAIEEKARVMRNKRAKAREVILLDFGWRRLRGFDSQPLLKFGRSG